MKVVVIGGTGHIGTFLIPMLVNAGYEVSVDTKTVNGNEVLFTGGKARIMQGETIVKEFIIVVSGDTNGDGKLNYLDYVKVYNHIQKEKNPQYNGNLLVGMYEMAGDMSGDNKINYLDYVKIYNKIQELKGGTN